MTALTGGRPIGRLLLRLDRAWWPLWVTLMVLVIAVTPGTFEGLYPDVADRAGLTQQIGSNGSLKAITGPTYDLSTPGGFMAWRVYGFIVLMGALVSAMSVIRHTRAEEESSRLELLRSGVLGRYTSLAMALLSAFGWSVITAIGATAVLVAVGTPFAGSLAVGAGLLLTMTAFTGIGAVAAQVSEHARTSRAFVGGVVGLAYVLRAMADASTSLTALGWVSPLGWPQRIRPYADERWWVLLLPLALTVVSVTLAFVLERRRDFGGALLATRLGPATGRMGSVEALTARLQRGSLIGWVIGMGLASVGFGLLAPGIADIFKDNPASAEMLRRMGGAQILIKAFCAAMLPILAAISMFHGVSAVGRLASEETDGRAEYLLSGAVPRLRLFVSHAAWAVVGACLLATLNGVGMALGYHLAGGREALAGSIVVGGLVYLAPMLVVVGLASVAVGIGTRWARAGWAAAVVVLVLAWVGEVLRLPDRVLDLSPLRHVPAMPGHEMQWTPVLVELGLAAGLLVAGAALYRRRDLTT